MKKMAVNTGITFIFGLKDTTSTHFLHFKRNCLSIPPGLKFIKKRNHKLYHLFLLNCLI